MRSLRINCGEQGGNAEPGQMSARTTGRSQSYEQINKVDTWFLSRQIRSTRSTTTEPFKAFTFWKRFQDRESMYKRSRAKIALQADDHQLQYLYNLLSGAKPWHLQRSLHRELRRNCAGAGAPCPLFSPTIHQGFLLEQLMKTSHPGRGIAKIEYRPSRLKRENTSNWTSATKP